jgi:hypothetical protein
MIPAVKSILFKLLTCNCINAGLPDCSISQSPLPVPRTGYPNLPSAPAVLVQCFKLLNRHGSQHQNEYPAKERHPKQLYSH